MLHGRPVEVDSDQIETLIKNNQRSTMWDIANILKISKSIKLLVKMKTVSYFTGKKSHELFGQPNTFYYTIQPSILFSFFFRI